MQVERICFQVEEAQWYYEDFIRPLDPDLPSLNLKDFCLRIFKHCPLLSQYSEGDHLKAFHEFLAYKTRVPVRGAILVNHDLDSVVLVRGWKSGASWSFPRGKINKDEPDLDCAIREVYEETGFNIRDAGLVPKDEDMKALETTLRAQHVRLYVFRDVPMDTHFEPRTRKEIGKIQWYKLSELPTQKKGKNNSHGGVEGELANHANKFYMVAPFIHPLKKWISQQKKLSKRIEAPKQILTHEPTIEAPTSARHWANETTVDTFVDSFLSVHKMGKPSTDLPSFHEKLGLPDPAITSQPSIQTPNPRPNSSETSIREQKSQSLLALLQGKPMNKATDLPQTPAEQIVFQPQMPPSPKHHVKLKQPVGSREVPSLLHATNQALQTSQSQTADLSGEKPWNREQFILNTLRNNQPTARAEKIQSHPQASKAQINGPNKLPSMVSTRPPAISPFASLEQPTGFASAIPAASKLPPPKLTAQSSKLLDLFKSNKPTKAALDTAPTQMDPSHLGVRSGLLRGPFNAADQASLEVSEIEDHQVDNAGQPVREPSEVSFEMPANLDSHSLPNVTPPRSQVGAKHSPRDNLAAWHQFQSTDATQQTEGRRRFAERDAEKAAEEASTGVKYEPVQPVFRETWKRVEIDSDERRVVDVTKHKPGPRHEASQYAIDDSAAPTQSSQGQKHDGTLTNGQASTTIRKPSTAKGQIIDNLAATEDPSGTHSNYGVSEAEPNEPAMESQPREMPAVIAPSPTSLHPARSDHRNTLLSILKESSAQPRGSYPVSKSTLEAPTPSFELSAIPSPGHSREPSRQAGPLGVQPVGDMSHILPMSPPTVKRQKAKLAPRRSPVSATVDGPLNVPQFDMLAQKQPSAVKTVGKSPEAETPRRSPITILTRPSKSQVSTDQQPFGTAAPQATTPATIPQNQSTIVTSPTPQSSTKPPPLTTASLSSVPPASQNPKATQPSMPPPPPHTIRRPLHIRPQAHDSILSPISPLPSPKHSLAFDRRGQQTKEQKQSLLSLFNNTSSPTPPPVATDSPMTGKKEGAMPPQPLPPSRVDSTASALISPPAVQVGFKQQGGLKRTGTGKSIETTSSGRETPKDAKSFLLGYLDSVAQGKR